MLAFSLFFCCSSKRRERAPSINTLSVGWGMGGNSSALWCCTDRKNKKRTRACVRVIVWMCVCETECVCMSVREIECVYESACVWVWVWVWEKERSYECVCVWIWGKATSESCFFFVFFFFFWGGGGEAKGGFQITNLNEACFDIAADKGRVSSELAQPFYVGLQAYNLNTSHNW